MGNYPMGAEYDDSAPYNEKEKVVKFDVNIKGVYYYPYKGSLDIEDMLSKVQEALKEEFENVRDGNIDVVHFDISVF